MDKFAASSIIVLLAICMWLYYDTRTLSEENARLAATVASSEKYIDALEGNLKLNEQITEERESFEVFIKEYSDASQKALRDLLRNDAEATDWSNTPIPSGLLQLHKNSAAARSHDSADTDSSTGTSAVPGTERDN